MSPAYMASSMQGTKQRLTALPAPGQATSHPFQLPGANLSWASTQYLGTGCVRLWMEHCSPGRPALTIPLHPPRFWPGEPCRRESCLLSAGAVGTWCFTSHVSTVLLLISPVISRTLVHCEREPILGLVSKGRGTLSWPVSPLPCSLYSGCLECGFWRTQGHNVPGQAPGSTPRTAHRSASHRPVPAHQGAEAGL